MGLKINGSTSGSIEIDVPAVAGTDTAITIPATTGGEFIVSDANGNVDLGALDISGSASADSVNIDASGRLLVGTSTYAGNARLVAAGNTGGSAGTLDITWTGSRPTAANTDIGYIRWYVAENSSSNAHYASIHASSDGASSGTGDIPGRLTFSTTKDGASSPTEAFRVNRFQELVFPDSSASWNIKSSRPSGSNQGHIVFTNGGSSVGQITTSPTSTAYTNLSDYRLKENVSAVTDGITRLQQLNPSRFNFIADPDTTVDGFIAHEVQTIVPEAITGEKDAVDDEGNPVYQGIDQSKLVPLLTAALQEAIGRIETLETANASQAATIAAMEARLTALEGGAA